MKYKVSFSIDFRRNKYKGTFIALDGLDGSGKTTASLNLVKALKKKGIKALYTKEPTDEPTGKMIRSILGGEISVPPQSFQYLFVADRTVHLKWVEDKLQKGYTVVTDRYFWSSVSYGIADRGERGDWYMVALSILSCYHRFLLPDYNFYLDIKPETGLKRINVSREKKELYEKKSKLLEIKKGYDFLLKKFKKEFIVIDASQSKEQVVEDILKHIKTKKK